MATISVTKTDIHTAYDFGFTAIWPTMTNSGSDVGEAIEMFGSADRSVQVTGTFGTGGTIRIEGSNDGSNYYPLTDPQGNNLDFTSAKIEAVSEITRYIRPRVTAGDGTTSLTVTMLLRRPVR